jgi:hypothetical protein
LAAQLHLDKPSDVTKINEKLREKTKTKTKTKQDPRPFASQACVGRVSSLNQIGGKWWPSFTKENFDKIEMFCGKRKVKGKWDRHRQNIACFFRKLSYRWFVFVRIWIPPAFLPSRLYCLFESLIRVRVRVRVRQNPKANTKDKTQDTRQNTIDNTKDNRQEGRQKTTDNRKDIRQGPKTMPKIKTREKSKEKKKDKNPANRQKTRQNRQEMWSYKYKRKKPTKKTKDKQRQQMLQRPPWDSISTISMPTLVS